MKTSQILCWQYLRHLKHNELLLLKSKFVITLLKTSSVELSNTVLWLLINWATSRSNFRIWELMQLKNISRKYIFNVSQQTTTVIDSIFEELCCQYKQFCSSIFTNTYSFVISFSFKLLHMMHSGLEVLYQSFDVYIVFLVWRFRQLKYYFCVFCLFFDFQLFISTVCSLNKNWMKAILL